MSLGKSSFKHLMSSPQLLSSNKREDFFGLAFIWASAILVVIVLGVTLGYIFLKGSGKLVSLSYLLDPPQGGRNDQGGILYPIIGTIYLTGGAVLLATPIGIFSAVALSEYLDPKSRFTKMARFAIDSLAGIPSIIFGLFGLAFFVSFLHFNHSLLAGAFSVGIMILPFIIRTVEEAIQTVPRTYREASLALGGNKTQTIFRVILPAAFPGIFTGVMLAISRAVAESAIVILAAGGSITTEPRLLANEFPYLLPDSGRTLAVHLYYQATSYDDTSRAFATALVLIFAILLLNVLAMFSFSKRKSQG